MINTIPIIVMRSGREISINKAVFRILGSPSNIQFWFGKSEKVLLIEGTSEKTQDTFIIGEWFYTYNRGGFYVRNCEFIKRILKFAQWKRKLVYKVIGEYIPEMNMVAFKLQNAEVLEGNNGQKQ